MKKMKQKRKMEKKNNKIKFTKMSGAGNDFIIIPALKDADQKAIKKFLGKVSREDFALKMCHRQLGIGADGLLFLEKPDVNGASIRWDFYNSDGSRPEMCANASRCVVRYLVEEKISNGKPLKIQTPFGVIHGRKKKDLVTIKIPKVSIFDLKKKVLIGNENVEGGWIDSGVPHFVVRARNVHEHHGRIAKAAMLRNHPYFHPRGTNVTFIEEIGKNELNAVSFERGVENFTLACGTGAVAAAIYYCKINGTNEPVKINMPGGTLAVGLTSEGDVELTGPALRVCDGVVHREVLSV